MADPIWLQKLKKRFGQSLSSERITPKRPNFTGTPGYNTEMPEVPAPENWLRHGIDGVKIEGGLEGISGTASLHERRQRESSSPSIGR